MALLQIAEPGQSPQPHQRRLAEGIDLGTTNSLVAAVRSGEPALIPLLADRDLSNSGIEVELLGESARVAAGPAALRQ